MVTSLTSWNFSVFICIRVIGIFICNVTFIIWSNVNLSFGGFSNFISGFTLILNVEMKIFGSQTLHIKIIRQLIKSFLIVALDSIK